MSTSTPNVPSIGTPVRVLGGGSHDPGGSDVLGTVVGAGFWQDLTGPYHIRTHLITVALVRLYTSLVVDDGDVLIQIIPVTPENLEVLA